MALYTVYRHPVLARYRSSVCSRSTLFVLTATVLTYISPLLVSYRSHGFWVKTRTYEEQPVVRFQYEVVLVASTSVQGDYVSWSTFPHFNRLQGLHLRLPSVSVREEDVNHDGKLDRLLLELQLPLSPDEQLYSLQMLLTFSYQLFRMSTVAMQSLVYVHYSSAVPGARLFISGDLQLQQRAPLPHRGLHNVYNVCVVDGSSPFAHDYDFEHIMRKYQQRNLTTRLSPSLPVWTPGRAASAPFELHAEIHYPSQTITYRPGFWESVKLAWVQYVSVLLLFLWLFQRLQTYVFEKQLLTTVPEPGGRGPGPGPGPGPSHHKVH